MSVFFFDEVVKVDDPVGATSVHLANGVWGTLAVGIWGKYKVDAEGGVLAYTSQGGETFYYSFVSQLYGVFASAIFCFVTAFIILYVIKKVNWNSS